MSTTFDMPEDVRECYEEWRETPARNIAALARSTGIPRSTLMEWRDKYHWRQHAALADLDLARDALTAGYMAAVDQIEPALLYLRGVWTDEGESTRTRMQAARIVIEYVRDASAQRGVPLGPEAIEALAPTTIGGHTQAELDELAIADPTQLVRLHQQLSAARKL